MNLNLEFINIIDAPECVISVNALELYKGLVQTSYQFDLDIVPGNLSLVIEHINKRPEDTQVVDGKIVRDRSFELSKILIDGYDLEDLIWQSEFRANDGAIYPSCLFFGPNGQFVLECNHPILPWLLEQRHAKTGLDPDWQEDYDYYTKACKILKQISNR